MSFPWLTITDATVLFKSNVYEDHPAPAVQAARPTTKMEPRARTVVERHCINSGLLGDDNIKGSPSSVAPLPFSEALLPSSFARSAFSEGPSPSSVAPLSSSKVPSPFSEVPLPLSKAPLPSYLVVSAASPQMFPPLTDNHERHSPASGPCPGGTSCTG